MEGEIRDVWGRYPRGFRHDQEPRHGLSASPGKPQTGFYKFTHAPVGRYQISVDREGLTHFRRQPVQLSVSQTVRLDVILTLAGQKESITVEGDAPLVDAATNTFGKTVTTREVLDLPLNGRNFTQLGLLQAGVAPLTPGMLQTGGSLGRGQGYAVNGQRPESNIYRVDGASNDNRMDGGFALRIPVEALAEFRILTHTAPPEYGRRADRPQPS